MVMGLGHYISGLRFRLIGKLEGTTAQGLALSVVGSRGWEKSVTTVEKKIQSFKDSAEYPILIRQKQDPQEQNLPNKMWYVRSSRQWPLARGTCFVSHILHFVWVKNPLSCKHCTWFTCNSRMVLSFFKRTTCDKIGYFSPTPSVQQPSCNLSLQFSK